MGTRSSFILKFSILCFLVSTLNIVLLFQPNENEHLNTCVCHIPNIYFCAGFELFVFGTLIVVN